MPHGAMSREPRVYQNSEVAMRRMLLRTWRNIGRSFERRKGQEEGGVGIEVFYGQRHLVWWWCNEN